MYWRLAYALPADGTYIVASATPVATCNRKAASVALPNTYAHPVSGGTLCLMSGRSLAAPPGGR